MLTKHDKLNESNGGTGYRHRRLPELNGYTATLIFLGGFLIQALLLFCIDLIVYAVVQCKGGNHSNNVLSTKAYLRTLSVVLSPLLMGIVTIWMSALLVKKSLRDTSPYGAAWVLGGSAALVKSFVIGIILGALVYISDVRYGKYIPYKELTSVGQMAESHGWKEFWFIIAATVVGPIAEELLFRGVMYGGFRRSLGRTSAFILTTGLFAAMHGRAVTELIPSIGIAAVGISTLWCRLRWQAIGPAVAVHFGYNVVTVGAIALRL